MTPYKLLKQNCSEQIDDAILTVAAIQCQYNTIIIFVDEA